MKKSLIINFRVVDSEDIQDYVEVNFFKVRASFFDVRSLSFLNWLEEETAKYDGVMCLSFSFIVPAHGDVLLYAYDTFDFRPFPSVTFSFRSLYADYKRYCLSMMFDEDCDLIKLLSVFLSEKQRVLLNMRVLL